MNSLISSFLLACFTFIGFCPTVMVNASASTCHEMPSMVFTDVSEKTNEEKDKNACIHKAIIENTVIPNFSEIKDTEQDIDVTSPFIGSVSKELYAKKVLRTISWNRFLVPPPSDWQIQKETIILQV